MAEAGLRHDQRLDEQVVDALLELAIRLAHALEGVDEALEAPFMRAIIVQVFVRVPRRILLKDIVLLIYRVIGQVHEQIADIVLCWSHVRLRRQTDQTVLEEEDPKRVDTHQEHVQS